MGILANSRIPHLALVILSCTSLGGVGCAQQGSAAVALPSLTDAPHFFHQKDGSVLAKWISGNKIKTRKFAKGKPIEGIGFDKLLGKKLHLEPLKVGPAIWEQPKKFLAISDVEGKFLYMVRFLTNSGVIDKDLNWTFGKGHLICIGDMLDRGEQVTETLLLLLRMYKDAKKAGGHVHFVLGNHEVMMMGGDVRYTAPKYKAVAASFGIPCRGLVGADTEIGRFMRTRHSLVRVGDYLFVHAGISTQIANTKLGIKKLNDLIRSVLGVPPTEIKDRFVQAVAWGTLGPLWYRGYFKEFEASFGPQPLPEAMDKILAAFGAKTIVIGHTQVGSVSSMFGKRRVIAIDIPWTDVNQVRGILVQGEKLEVVDVNGKRVPFK